MTSQDSHLARGLSNKKARAYYSFVNLYQGVKIFIGLALADLVESANSQVNVSKVAAAAEFRLKLLQT